MPRTARASQAAQHLGLESSLRPRGRPKKSQPTEVRDLFEGAELEK